MKLIGQSSDSVSGPRTNRIRSRGCLVKIPEPGCWQLLDENHFTDYKMPVVASQLQEEIDHMENFSAVLSKMTRQQRLPISEACQKYSRA